MHLRDGGPQYFQRELERVSQEGETYLEGDEGRDEERHGARSAPARIERTDNLQYRRHKVPFPPQCKET